MLVHIPSPLRSYTKNAACVFVGGATLDEVLHQLDDAYPGIRFRIINEQDRIRAHIKIFINDTVTEDLSSPIQTNDQIHIICALSGG